MKVSITDEATTKRTLVGKGLCVVCLEAIDRSCVQQCVTHCWLVFIFQQVFQILDERRQHHKSRTDEAHKEKGNDDSCHEVNDEVHTTVHCIPCLCLTL